MYKRFVKLSITVLALLTADQLTAADTVFKTKDVNGNAVFSDQGSEQAEEVKIQAPQTFKPQAQPTRRLSGPSDVAADVGFAYDNLQILSPEHNSAFRNNAGNVTVKVAIAPPLQANHSIQFMVDGVVMRTQKSTSALIPNLDRGTHQFQAQVIEDKSGEVLQSSNGVTSTLQRISVQPRISNSN